MPKWTHWHLTVICSYDTHENLPKKLQLYPLPARRPVVLLQLQLFWKFILSFPLSMLPMVPLLLPLPLPFLSVFLPLEERLVSGNISCIFYMAGCLMHLYMCVWCIQNICIGIYIYTFVYIYIDICVWQLQLLVAAWRILSSCCQSIMAKLHFAFSTDSRSFLVSTFVVVVVVYKDVARGSISKFHAIFSWI